jgi:hypothetical protein
MVAEMILLPAVFHRQEIVDETLEGRKDDDKNQIQDEEKEKRLETILESVKDKMDKQVEAMTRQTLSDRNFPCQTLKIRNVSLVVMGS